MADRYKIRCSLFGHQKDVRAVAAGNFPTGSIVSGSRDMTTRIWAPNETDLGFTVRLEMRGHTRFVSCICILPPDETNPHGLILTGSNDKTILAYTLDSPTPQYKLEGHGDTVCALSAGKFGSLLSGSWDRTAKVWLQRKCVMTLEGHSAAVWSVAVMPEGGYMLTGSADKFIKMWKAGKCERTFTGHTDCVRAFAVMSTNEFLSCSNDASVRHWLTSGECLHTYFGHSNFVYSVALLPNGQDFLSTGEDRTLRVWRGGKCEQTITHPAQSVWSVCVLDNGDIITGASDGVVRVFSRHPERQAEANVQAAFEASVAESAIPTQVGDVPIDQLPGPEVLINPGTKEGQTIMVKDGDKVEAYQWDSAAGRWIKIGDVVGGSGGSQASSGKQLYNGKEYDFVFDVEIHEGQPALKLPFNLSEDPWMAAHTFLQRNDISPMFLDQVAKFVQAQTKGMTLGQGGPPGGAGADPFTGGSRYMPGTGVEPGMALGGTDPLTGGGRHIPSYSDAGGPAQPTPAAADPFTGSGSYRPSYGAGKSAASATTHSQGGAAFPLQTFLSFDQANQEAILGKLKGFNEGMEERQKLNDSEFSGLSRLMAGGAATAQQINTLWKVLQWPAGCIFPALDILRLAIRSESVNEHFCNIKDGSNFLDFLLLCLSPEGLPANRMLVLRTLCNAFRQAAGKMLLLAERERVLAAISKCDVTSKALQIAASSLLLNYAVAYQASEDLEAKCECLSAAEGLAAVVTDPEASYRLLVGLGTLIHGDQNSTHLAQALELAPFVKRCQKIADPAKVKSAADQLAQVLK